MFVNKIGVRRLWALLRGLPPDSAVWREDTFTPTEEFLVQIMERQHAWNESILGALMGHKKVSVPAAPQILRPGEEMPQPRKVETDPRVIAAWFQEHLGNG